MKININAYDSSYVNHWRSEYSNVNNNNWGQAQYITPTAGLSHLPPKRPTKMSYLGVGAVPFPRFSSQTRFGNPHSTALLRGFVGDSFKFTV